MEILNKAYYKTLWDKYKTVDSLPLSFSDNTSLLSFKLILSKWKKKEPLHINFQNKPDILSELSQHLYIELANEIFCNGADFPPFNPGDKVRSKKEMRVGKPKPLRLDFTVRELPNGKYRLDNKKFGITIERSFDELVRHYTPLSQNAHNETITKFLSFFEKLNGKKIHDFEPTYFDRKFVFIAPKTMWDTLENKNKIPSIYIPNPREENSINEIKSIPALPDCVMYLTPKYEVCYQEILKTGKKIDTIIICNTEEEKTEQILQDKSKFGFNLIFITNTLSPSKITQIPCWNWFKEEIDIVNSL